MEVSTFGTALYGERDLGGAYSSLRDLAQTAGAPATPTAKVSSIRRPSISPLAKSTPTPMNELDLAAIHERLAHLRPGGKVEAIPVLRVEEDETEHVGRITRSIQVPSFLVGTSAQFDAIRQALTVAIRQEARASGAIRAEVRGALPFQTVIQSVEAHGAPEDYSIECWEVLITDEPVLQTEITEGPTETRYFIVRDGTAFPPTWDDGYDTEQEAVEHLPRSAARFPLGAVERYSVLGLTRRASGAALVVHTLTPHQGETVTVRVVGAVRRLVKRGRPTGEQGWYFYGLSA